MTLAPDSNDSTPSKCKRACQSGAGSAERPHLREVWLQGRVLPQLRVGVLVVDIVAHADKLLPMVGTGDEDDGHTDGITLRDEGWVGGISLRETHPGP